MSTMITHAPSVNLVTAKMISTTNDRKAPMPLMTSPRCQPGSLFLHVVLGHARLATA